MKFIESIFKRDYVRFSGVRNINIYLMRLVFLLTFLFVGKDSWTHILNHTGGWDPLHAVAFSVWAAYATLSIVGVIHTLKMIPLILFQILYKIIWLVVVAYPLWAAGELTNSPAEGITSAFLWVALPIIAVPWAYVFKNYFSLKRQVKAV